MTRVHLPPSLVEQMRIQRDARPDAAAITLLAGDDTRILTRADLWAGAAVFAAAFLKAGMGAGEVVVLVGGHGERLLFAFWGALLIGAAPSIFPFLSEKLDPARYFASVRVMIDHAGAKWVVADARCIPDLRQHLPDKVQIIASEFIDLTQTAPPFALPAIQTNAVAFLQHSSGSTGIQKGVMLSHRAVIDQIINYSDAIDLHEDDVIVSWLPLYHDMGLIAGFILPIVQGIPLVLLSPFEWVRDPKRLLTAIQQQRGTLCWLPNFAYNFMALQIRERTFDLSSMRAFINCSEPVYQSSHDLFLGAFAVCGVRPEMLAVCYAMAENTFAVTQTTIGQPPRQFDSAQAAAFDKVSCGRPIPGCEVRITDERRQPLPDGQIGEIAVRSGSMLTGYHHRPDDTAAALVDGWFYTGDLGFLVDGELVVSGRKKDLIIVGGKNIYPHDIEYLVSEIPGVHRGRVAAFGVFNERLATEDIAIVAEIDTDDALRIERAIRARIAQATEVGARYVHLVGAGWLVKTSSGKVARSANREKFLAEVLRPAAN